MPTFTHFLEEDQQTERWRQRRRDVTAAPTASSGVDQLLEQGNTLINELTIQLVLIPTLPYVIKSIEPTSVLYLT